ncbi:helix-turn-helix transcriptional regulator [Bordetella genomosp. 11]|uniref:Uncharacterized protein n=1 Tax=Bordetella genomosp. 11 TaxID=1416808 RepID=A0A261UE77_9BORD|nr:AlpA family phage regulatory protein [Bordetella genomosp. 11]OZI59901.1 hypothetical protein CAL28_10450 [Bordetella genomosp. 11]
MNETMTNQPAAPEKLLYRMKDLPRVVGISRSEIYRQLNAGKFPKGINLTPKVVVWKAEDLRKWVDELVP